MRIMKRIVAVFVVSAFVCVALAGCEKHETAGEKLDHAIDNTKNAAKELGK